MAHYVDIGSWSGIDELTEYMEATHAPMQRTNHMMSRAAPESTAATYMVTFTRGVAGARNTRQLDSIGHLSVQLEMK